MSRKAGRTLLRKSREFTADTRGATALVFGLSFIPIVMIIGLTAILSDVFAQRDRLNVAADAAALSAVSYSYLNKSATTARTNALTVFTGQSTIPGVTLKSYDVTVTDNLLTRTAVAKYSAEISMPFLGLFANTTMAFSGTATAVNSLPTFIDFYLLLDNTPSMGIGATLDDINKMVANTSDQCAFACHEMDTSPNDYYGLAKKLGVTMRIDVVRTATQQLMDTATAAAQVTGQYRAAIYTFGVKAEARALTTIASLTSDLASAKTAASAIDLMTVPYQGYNNDQDTDYDGMLAAINGNIATPGDGSTATSPQKVLFFVTDGVADAYYPTTCTQADLGGGRCQEPITVANCTAIKNRGIKIAVLYTTYYPLTTNWWYNNTIVPFTNQIAPNMQSCASPGLYFEVSPSQGISAAMTALFNAALKQARLSQ